MYYAWEHEQDISLAELKKKLRKGHDVILVTATGIQAYCIVE